MKSRYSIGITVFSMFLSICFWQCNTLKTSESISLDAKQASKTYYQNWVLGVRGGGSGTDIFISKDLLKNKLLDSVYFKGKGTSLESNKTHYIGYFKKEISQIIEGVGTVNENDSKTADKKTSIPFELNNNEAVVSYSENGKTKYLKLTNIREKKMLAYPPAPKP